MKKPPIEVVQKYVAALLANPEFCENNPQVIVNRACEMAESTQRFYATYGFAFCDGKPDPEQPAILVEREVLANVLGDSTVPSPPSVIKR